MSVSEAREELSAAVKEIMRTAESVPKVDGWDPGAALMMGALYAVEAITLDAPDLVLAALGGKPGREVDWVAGRCPEHDDLAKLYSDGSVSCMHAIVVEQHSGNCSWEPMPSQWLGRERADVNDRP